MRAFAEFLDAHNGTITALATLFIAWFTLRLTRSTDKLWKAGKDALETTERAFVFLDGFNVELTTAADTIVDSEKLPEWYRSHRQLYITRFAVQPRWKNGGNTPTRKMMIRVDSRGPVGPVPPEYAYQNSPDPFFLAPKAVEPSAFIEMPSPQALIDHAMGLAGPTPMLFLWGRADYADVFGQPHFIEWCRQVRFEDHAGEKLRAGFIQWGDYNRSDEDCK